MSYFKENIQKWSFNAVRAVCVSMPNILNKQVWLILS